MAKVFLLLVALFSGAVLWMQMTRHVIWESYAALAAQVERGRTNPDDLPRIQGILTRGLSENCAALRARTPVTLHLHAGDLIALQAGVNPLAPSDLPDLTAQRKATSKIVERALACSPSDGDLWLSLAIIARALDAPAAQIVHFLALSEEYAPHEGWVMSRRDRLF